MKHKLKGEVIMAIPKSAEIYTTILEFMSDGKIHTNCEIRNNIIAVHNVSESEQKVKFNCGDLKFNNVVDTAINHLRYNGLLLDGENRKIGQHKISEKGIEELKVRNGNCKPETETKIKEEVANPAAAVHTEYEKYFNSLVNTILDEIAKISPRELEVLSVKLLERIIPGRGEVTQYSNDNGIDGVIYPKQIGLNPVYVQTKKWKDVIGRPDLQQFYGALKERRSSAWFITTSRFSKDAEAYAEEKGITLVDGPGLAKLLIEYNFGVVTTHVYEIKTVDKSAFILHC